MPWTYQTDYADSLRKAQTRFRRALNHDPFPKIEGALLNSAHIAAYAREAGLIHKFDPRMLKSATYPGHIGKRVYHWDPEKPEEVIYTTEFLDKTGDTFKIQKFSLVYVETEEIFLLPHYIAARFNLQIEFVHKGLLLGTGPLVDPGFAGPLLIPLHNYTANTYELARGQPLIWVEFTKTTAIPGWAKGIDEVASRSEIDNLISTSTQPKLPKSFNRKKWYLPARNYFDSARRDRFAQKEEDHEWSYPSIVNAIPKEVAAAHKTSMEASNIAIDARKKVKVLERRWTIAAFISGAVVATALIAIVYQAVALQVSLRDIADGLRAKILQIENARVPRLHDSITKLEAGTAVMDKLRVRLDALEKRLGHLEDRSPVPGDQQNDPGAKEAPKPAWQPNSSGQE
jgi:deoxycytidine triphosphate deaminase